MMDRACHLGLHSTFLERACRFTPPSRPLLGCVVPSIVRKAVFPAAGLGTRFLPVTKAQPKEMLPLVDKPIIQYGVEEAMASGCDQILIITGRGKQAIEDHFDVSYELETMLEQRNKTDLLKIVRSISDMIHVRSEERRG